MPFSVVVVKRLPLVCRWTSQVALCRITRVPSHLVLRISSRRNDTPYRLSYLSEGALWGSGRRSNFLAMSAAYIRTNASVKCAAR